MSKDERRARRAESVAAYHEARASQRAAGADFGQSVRDPQVRRSLALVATLATLVVLAVLLVACGSIEEPTPPVEEPTPPVEEPTPDPVGYGSDPVLDAYQDACADGDAAACEDLYWNSPFGSEYEAYAQEQGAPSATATDEELHDLAFATLRDTMSESERAAFCAEYERLGLELTYQYFAEGYGPGAPSLERYRTFTEEVCP